MNKDALAVRLRATFLGELDEQVRTLNADLLALESTPLDATRLRSVFRVVHTLKGAARAAGIPLIEAVCHELEAGLIGVRDGKGALHADDFTRLFAAADALSDAGVRLRAGEDLTASPLADFAAALARGILPVSVGRAAPLSPADTVKQAGTRSSAVADRSVRIAATRLDALLAATSELTVIDSRFIARANEVDELRALAASWTAEWRRARSKLQRALGDTVGPEAVRSLGWVDENLRRLTHETERLTAGLADDARALAQATGRISDRVRHIRLRPFADACEALPRVVRDVAVVVGKEVVLTVDGGDVQADREVLDAVRDALLHLVRNAVDHGIEPPAERQQRGKPKAGTVRITAELRGERLVVAVADDGRGLDVPAIQARLREEGHTDPPTAPADLGQRLLQGGLSTRREAGLISGRGVGIDAVRDAIERIRGRLAVDWIAGQGTTFTLTCPPSLTTVRVLLVTMAEHTLAFPCADVEHVSRLRGEAIKQAGGRDVMLSSSGESIPLASLAQLFGTPMLRPDDADYLTVVTLAVSGRRVGVVVDRAVAEQEIVLRPLRTGRSRVPLVSGAAPLGTGRVVLLLDPVAVVAAGLGTLSDTLRPATRLPETPSRRILVVDDALTTRALEQSVLEAAGYEVTTAVDGAQAWNLLQNGSYDLVVSDVEMPRMDGFALCEAIRGSRRHDRLPVILVTALDAPEHRARGLEAGADAYLAKGAFEQDVLLDTVRRLVE